MRRADLLTRSPYHVQVFRGETDITEASGVRTIQYLPDGQALQTRRDGSVQRGRWELLADETVIRMTMEQSGVSDWTILELSETVFRKHFPVLDMLAVQTPVGAVVDVRVTDA